MSSNLATTSDSERTRSLTSLAPSGNAAGSVEGGNIEDGDGGVGDDTSNFGGRVVGRISDTGNGDGATVVFLKMALTTE